MFDLCDYAVFNIHWLAGFASGQSSDPSRLNTDLEEEWAELVMLKGKPSPIGFLIIVLLHMHVANKITVSSSTLFPTEKMAVRLDH